MSIRKLYTCRRTLIAISGIVACVGVTLITKVDTSGAIAMIVAAIAGANATQGVFESKSKSNSTENRQSIRVDAPTGEEK